MKRSTTILACLIVFSLGAALGYAVGVRRGVHRSYLQHLRDYEGDAQFHAELIARSYFDCLQALDAGSAQGMTNLRRHAMSSLKLFVSGVHEAQAQGYHSPVNKELYTNIVTYLAEHPASR